MDNKSYPNPALYRTTLEQELKDITEKQWEHRDDKAMQARLKKRLIEIADELQRIDNGGRFSHDMETRPDISIDFSRKTIYQ